MNMLITFDKAYGIMIGMALGDALGAPFEFHKSQKLSNYTGKLDLPSRRYLMYKGCFKYQVGQITDDTEMALCIINSLIKNNGKYCEDDTIMNYLEWANSKNNYSMGKNTKKLFKGIKTIKGYRKRIEKSELYQTTQSNGSLMRCPILALCSREDFVKDCKITNASEVNEEVHHIYYDLMRLVLNGRVKKDIKLYLEDLLLDEFPEIEIAIKEAIDFIERDITVNKSWVVHGIYCTIVGLLHFDNYKTAIDWIIKQGGDTDTNACIAGGFLGAYYGFNELEKVEKENIKILLECDTTQGEFPRHEKYTLVGIKDKIKTLVGFMK